MDFYLTPASIAYLAQLILAVGIAGYLANLAATRQAEAVHTRLLAATFGAASALILLYFLQASLDYNTSLYAQFLQNSLLALALLLLLQFIYHFPTPLPGQKWEARLALLLSCLYLALELWLAFSRFRDLRQNHLVSSRPAWGNWPVVLLIGWILWVWLRQIVRQATNSGPWWRKLWQPEGQQAQAAWAFSQLLGLLFALGLTELAAQDFKLLSADTRSIILSLGFLFIFFTFALIYVNYLPDSTTFLVKIVGMALVITLAILGGTGWSLQPVLLAQSPASQAMSLERHTYRFTPREAGGYQVTNAPFVFADELGGRLELENLDMAAVPLAFPFPFQGQDWQQLYVHDDGYVNFPAENAILDGSVTYRYGAAPAIFAFFRDLQPISDPNSGIFVQNSEQSLLLTWQNLPEREGNGRRYTFQLVLYPGGAFDITLVRIPAVPAHELEQPVYGLIGATPGNTSQFTLLDLPAGLPTQSDTAAMMADPYLSFRRYLHRSMLPLAYLILTGSLFIIVVFVRYYRHTLIRPLAALQKGLQQVNEGQLNLTIPILYQDEIGFLSTSFNDTVAELRSLVTDLEKRVAERTADVQTQTARVATSEANYRRLVEEIDETIVRWALPEQTLVYISPAAEQVFGYTAQAFRDHPALFQQMVQPDFVFYTQMHWSETVAGRYTHPYEYKIVDPTGRERWIQQANQLIFNGADQLVAAQCLYRDVTGRKVSAQQLLDQQHDLATLAERERIGLELHESLGQVMSYVNVQAQAIYKLLADGQTAEAAISLRQLARVAQDAHSDIREFILGMRVGSPPDGMNGRPGFFTVLEQYLESFNQRYGIQSYVSRPPTLEDAPFSQEVETQLFRIIQEVMTNIYKHAGVKSAQLLFMQEAHYVQVVIADNGRGFDAQITAAGASLPRFGLEMMRQRSEAVAGRLEIHSALGKGTQVILHMPRLMATLTATTSPGTTRQAAGLRVILVDDHPIFLEGLRAMLAARGIQVIGLGHNGLEAQELVRQLKPDLVIMDLYMPDHSGLEATRQIKTGFPGVKIVLVALAADDDLVFEALKQGAAGVLPKNLDSAEFFDRLAEILRGEVALAPALAGRFLAEIAQQRPGPAIQPLAGPGPLALLSPRKLQILREVARGRTYRQIAESLKISEPTVKFHMGEILEQLQLRSRHEAIDYYSRQAGLN